MQATNYLIFKMKNLIIDILAFGALLSSVLVITSKNPVIAVIFLISVFINAAGYLILLGIGFIGISYIIIYIGAITVLFLFVIMLLNIRLSDLLEAGSLYTKNIPLAIAIGSLFIYEIFTIIPFSFNDVSLISSLLNLITNLNGLFLNSDISTVNVVYNTINPISAETSFINLTQVQVLGQYIYTTGSFWLIITSVILLLAMVSAIFVTHKPTQNTHSAPIPPLNGVLNTNSHKQHFFTLRGYHTASLLRNSINKNNSNNQLDLSSNIKLHPYAVTGLTDASAT